MNVSIVQDRAGTPPLTGEVNCLLGIATDITERKKAEEELSESNERFKAAFTDAAIGMTLVSLDHTIIEANPAYCNMLGYTKDELKGVFLKDVTHPDDVENSLDYHHKLIAGELDHYHIEKRYIHKQGISILIPFNDSSPIEIVTILSSLFS